MHLDSIVEEKTMKKIRSWEGQPSLDEMLEKNQLISLLVHPLISNGSKPLDDHLGLEKAIINKCLKIGFRALTPVVVAIFFSFPPTFEAPRLFPSTLVVTRCFTHILRRERRRSSAPGEEELRNYCWYFIGKPT